MARHLTARIAKKATTQARLRLPQLSIHAPFGALTFSEDAGAIAARGRGGYSEGQGLDTKRYLIQLEARPA